MTPSPLLTNTLRVLEAALARQSEPRMVPGSIEAMNEHLAARAGVKA